MSKRLTRKQIKEDIRHDELQEAVSTTVDTLKSHQQQVIIAVVVVVVLAVGAAVLKTYLDHRNVQGNVDLAQAMKVYDAPVVETDAKPDDPKEPSFADEDERRARAREAMEDVGGGAAGDVADLYLARIALDEGDKEAARERWEAFLKDHNDDILALSVRLNLLRLDREEGHGEEVAEKLLGELDSPEPSLPEDVLLFELATTLDGLDRGDEAAEYYQRIVDEHPTSPYAAKARERTTS